MLTLPWRKKEEGFQWVEHENTQVKHRREAREERLSALGYLVRIFTSLMGLKSRALFETLLLIAARAKTAIGCWIKNDLPRHVSRYSVYLSTFFTQLLRTGKQGSFRSLFN